MKRKITPLIAGAPVAFALIASGCGVAAGATPYGAAAASATETAAGAANVKTADSSIGRILVDGKGRTLYLFEKDRNHRSTCYGPCAAYWPPLLIHGKPQARAGAKQSIVSWVRRSDGSQQVTYAGHPVYRFAGDTKPGQTTGEGLR